MKTTPNIDTMKTCFDGRRHSFVLGSCFNCGLSIRAHREQSLALRRQRWHEKKKNNRRGA